MTLAEYLENNELVIMPGMDDALIGVAERAGHVTAAVYDHDAIVDILMKRDGASYEGALEYIGHNILGSWVGEDTPIVLTRFDDP